MYTDKLKYKELIDLYQDFILTMSYVPIDAGLPMNPGDDSTFERLVYNKRQQ